MKITKRQLRRIIREESKGSTKKYDDDSALRGKQSTLPDSLQRGIIDKTVEDREKREEEGREERNESVRITKRQLRRIIREATDDLWPDDDTPYPSTSYEEEEPRDLEPKRFTGHKARKRAENAAGNLVFDEAERGKAVHVVSLGDGEYGLYFAEYDGEDFYEDLPGADPEAETVIQVPRSRAIVYGPRRDWGGSRVKPGRY